MSKREMETLFDSKARVKILKYLFRNQEEKFTVRSVANHVLENSATVSKELKKLVDIGLLKRR